MPLPVFETAANRHIVTAASGARHSLLGRALAPVQYHGSLRDLAQRVCRYVREQDLLRAGDRVGVAVSGGADSVALLCLLLTLREELGLVLSLVHLNHQIRGAEAEADQQFVAELARLHGLFLHVYSADTPAYATRHRLSLEAAARQIRYQHFQQLLVENLMDKLATAHTLDDQAETVLLRLARGTGVTGLAGIYPRWSVATASCSDRAIVRPLLAIRRDELQAYLQSLGQSWREDTSNLDPRYTRNRVRHKVLPLLKSELNPRVPELLAETAAIARAEEDYWTDEVSRSRSQVWTAQAATGGGSLRVVPLCQLPLALRRRVVRAVAESLGLRLEFHHVEELLGLAQASPAGEKHVVLPSGWRVWRHQDRLQFDPPHAVQAPKTHGFAYTLSLPGQVTVAETGTVFRAMVGAISSEHAGKAYDPARLSGQLQVRNWRTGDRFWPGHTRRPKKVKELLQERKIPLAQRCTWPVITSAASGQEVVIWLRGFLPPEHLLATPGQAQGLLIEEFTLQEAGSGAE